MSLPVKDCFFFQHKLLFDFISKNLWIHYKQCVTTRRPQFNTSGLHMDVLTGMQQNVERWAVNCDSAAGNAAL